jgi:hypothetical protein
MATSAVTTSSSTNVKPASRRRENPPLPHCNAGGHRPAQSPAPRRGPSSACRRNRRGARPDGSNKHGRDQARSVAPTASPYAPP